MEDEMGAKRKSIDSANATLRRLGTNLLRLREARRWNQDETAARCGMNQQNYQRIEAGRVNVTMSTLTRLAGALEIDIADLLGPIVSR
jgi:transcriptional regulator with XRE-family HTH domain